MRRNYKMKTVSTVATRMRAALLVTLALLAVCATHAPAQITHQHSASLQQEELSHEQSQLLSIVREATERFKNVTAAQNEQYSLLFGCVTGPDSVPWVCTS
jgi:starvation-inducible outer membrane lipoprotein